MPKGSGIPKPLTQYEKQMIARLRNVEGLNTHQIASKMKRSRDLVREYVKEAVKAGELKDLSSRFGTRQKKTEAAPEFEIPKENPLKRHNPINLSCHYDICKSHAEIYYALVPVCMNHYETIFKETVMFYNKNIDERSHYMKIRSYSIWGRVKR